MRLIGSTSSQMQSDVASWNVNWEQVLEVSIRRKNVPHAVVGRSINRHVFEKIYAEKILSVKRA